jgi:hypothetical protein
MKIKPGSFLYAIGLWFHFWKLAGFPINRYALGVLKNSIGVWQQLRQKRLGN